jgi:hypothetical protein
MGVVSQPIQDSSTDDWVGKHVQPIRQGPVTGQNDGGVSIAGVHKLIEHFALALRNTPEGKIINDEQVMADEFAPGARVLGLQYLFQFRKKLVELEEPNLTKRPAGGMTQSAGQMGFSGAGWPGYNHPLPLVDKPAGGQFP